MTVELVGVPQGSPATPEARPTAYKVVPAGYDDFVHVDKALWNVYVVDGGSEHGWSIRRGGITSPVVLRADFEWDFEPSPSSRTEKYLREHRWPPEEALERAMIAVRSVVLNGRTAAQASANVAARLAGEERKP